ncbi:universal stress protein UspA and related nucleotide-binding proteins [Vibrio variabilis]|uniref:Universal stress protein UspA and related nucleotide-binding proteins n=1 Tax=Vibrio variabilis TaxID=990271 RepID=A0ABQ0JQB5_9VIBR|nr:universal stress protein UspA and related nucleotide-binding proteins [Vibrio variabilis]
MSIRTILMPFATTQNAQERLAGALEVAKYFEAHLEVMHAQVGAGQLLPSENRLISRSLYKKIDQMVNEYIEESISESKEVFNRLCDDHRVNVSEPIRGETTALWHDIFRYRAEVVSEHGKVSDLIVIPKPSNGKTSVSFEAAIKHSARPVLLMPRKQSHFNPQTIMIAWNGDAAAARAVHASLPILKKAKEVVVVSSERSLVDKPDQYALATYLKAHDVQVSNSVLDTNKRETPKALLDFAQTLPADLIIAGAFAHRNLSRLVFGGVTKKLLFNQTIPLLVMS